MQRIVVNVQTGTVETVNLASEEIDAIIGPTPEQIIAAFTAAIDDHVETQARAWSYNSAAHLASYADSTVAQWAAEAAAFIAWRDAVWLAALGLLGDVQAGEAEPPADPAAFIAGLPALNRPVVAG